MADGLKNGCLRLDGGALARFQQTAPDFSGQQQELLERLGFTLQDGESGICNLLGTDDTLTLDKLPYVPVPGDRVQLESIIILSPQLGPREWEAWYNQVKQAVQLAKTPDDNAQNYVLLAPPDSNRYLLFNPASGRLVGYGENKVQGREHVTTTHYWETDGMMGRVEVKKTSPNGTLTERIIFCSEGAQLKEKHVYQYEAGKIRSRKMYTRKAEVWMTVQGYTYQYRDGKPVEAIITHYVDGRPAETKTYTQFNDATGNVSGNYTGRTFP